MNVKDVIVGFSSATLTGRLELAKRMYTMLTGNALALLDVFFQIHEHRGATPLSHEESGRHCHAN